MARSDPALLAYLSGRSRAGGAGPAARLAAAPGMAACWVGGRDGTGARYRHVTPVLLCHALGKTEEVTLALAEYGFAFALEKRCVPCAHQYALAGRSLPDWIELNGDPIADRVVIAPPVGKDEVRRLGRYRTALISGWAKDPEFARLFGADATFDLSDHCDFDELMEVVELTGADQVYTVHGFTEDFARALRRKGIRAWALEANEQLALAL